MEDLYNIEAAKLRGKGVRSRFSPLLKAMWRKRRLRPLTANLCRKLEGGDMFSITLREIYRESMDVEVGDYSYGVFDPNAPFPRGTKIGRYSSIAPGVKIYRRTRDPGRLSLHPFFFNKRVGVINEEQYPHDWENPLSIGNDVWIGYNVIILHECASIGDGAIVGAGSIVTTDIPPFAIAVGAPAKVVGWRFEEAVREKVIASQWWRRDVAELIECGVDMTRDLGGDDLGAAIFQATGKAA